MNISHSSRYFVSFVETFPCESWGKWIELMEEEFIAFCMTTDIRNGRIAIVGKVEPEIRCIMDMALA